MDKQVYEMAANKEEWMVIEGASHTDLYDIDKYFDPARTTLTNFLKILIIKRNGLSEQCKPFL